MNRRFFDWPDGRPTRSGRSTCATGWRVKDPVQTAAKQDSRLRCRRRGQPAAETLMDHPTRRGNYDSGQDYVLEYGELRFTFNERDFAERVEQAAHKLGFVGRPAREHRARGPRQPHRQRRGPGPGVRRSASTSTTAGPSSSAPPSARSCTGCAGSCSAPPGWTSASRRASSTSSSTTHALLRLRPARARRRADRALPEPNWGRVAYTPR